MRLDGASAGHSSGIHHEEFDHLAVFHDGVDDLAAQLSAWLPDRVAPGDAVFVCLDGAATEAVRPLLASHAGPVTVLPAAVRYQRPTGAVRLVHDFTREAMGAGARRVWSIGAVDLAGDDDGRWARYEAAVDDVLSHLPFVGVCAFDAGRLDAAALDVARRTHRHVQHADRCVASDAYAPRELSSTATWWIPAEPPTIELPARQYAEARRAIGLLASAAGCSPERVVDLQILTSELATNAVLHGTEPSCVCAWRGADRIVVQVVDEGPGIADAWPDLRPPTAGAIGGLGLWLVGQLADRFHIGRHAGTTTVTAAVELHQPR